MHDGKGRVRLDVRGRYVLTSYKQIKTILLSHRKVTCKCIAILRRQGLRCTLGFKGYAVYPIARTYIGGISSFAHHSLFHRLAEILPFRINSAKLPCIAKNDCAVV